MHNVTLVRNQKLSLAVGGGGGAPGGINIFFWWLKNFKKNIPKITLTKNKITINSLLYFSGF